MKNYFLNKGLVKTYVNSGPKEQEDGSFDLRKWLKHEMRYLRVPNFDPCCDGDSPYRPVRYNFNTKQTETYDSTSKTWVQTAIMMNSVRYNAALSNTSKLERWNGTTWVALP